MRNLSPWAWNLIPLQDGSDSIVLGVVVHFLMGSEFSVKGSQAGNPLYLVFE